jgi:hypothetical protein
MHAYYLAYGATAVKFPSSSKPPPALNRWKKIREGLRRIADFLGLLEVRFSFQILVAAATHLHFVPVQRFSVSDLCLLTG